MAANPSIRAPKRRPNGSAGTARRRRRLTPVRTLAFASVIAVAVVGILIGVSVTGSSSGSPATRLTGTAATSNLLAGIPQHGNVLGSPSAPVRLVEYGDLQCPVCRAFALGALPTIVRNYVRQGKVQIEFRGLAFLGPDSEKALRAVVAAGAQRSAWNLIDLLYRNQGPENGGWVSDDLLRSAAASIPGVDSARLFDERSSSRTDLQMRASAMQAESLMGSQLRTPTFQVGRAGEPLQVLPITSLDASAFTPALDQLLAE